MTDTTKGAGGHELDDLMLKRENAVRKLEGEIEQTPDNRLVLADARLIMMEKPTIYNYPYGELGGIMRRNGFGGTCIR